MTTTNASCTGPYCVVAFSDDVRIGTADLPVLDTQHTLAQPQYKPIKCVINDDYPVSCIRDTDDVFIPFDFIRHYFEVSAVSFCPTSVL